MALLENLLYCFILTPRFPLFCCFISLLFASLLYIRGRYQNTTPSEKDRKHPPAAFIYRNLHQAKTILSGSCFDNPNLYTILRSRSGPNDRLTRAFDIDNAFTTTDTRYHREFVACAANLINLSSMRWKVLASDIERLLQGNIERQQRSGDGTVLLSRLIQITILRAVFTILFPSCGSVELSEEVQDEIAYEIADKINSLWISSKTSHQHANPEDLASLMRACLKLLPGVMVTGSSRDNPLNLILPAFETLWRVVFRCFIEVRFRGKDGLRFNNTLFREYLDTPTSEVFNKVDSTSGVSISHIVSETLRLYPPTKRVYRQIQPDSIVRPDAAVDIQHIHHDPQIWGADAAEFRPSRWRKEELGVGMVGAFFPFGMKPLVCPARKVFGPRIIGMAVAALCVGFERIGEWEVVGGEGLNCGGLLENERDSYREMGIRLRR